jgi:hypothetical protein
MIDYATRRVSRATPDECRALLDTIRLRRAEIEIVRGVVELPLGGGAVAVSSVAGLDRLVVALEGRVL